MNKIRDTKNPTTLQLRNIAENLRDYLETYVSVSIKADFFRSGITEIRYGIYIERDCKATHWFETWQELLFFYRKLMNLTKEEV